MLYTPEIVQLSKDNTTPKFDKSKFDAAISWVYNQKEYGAEMLEQEPGMNLIRETGNILTDAFNQGVESGVLPPEMESKLRESVFVFSACKTHQELTEVSSLLRTTEGKVKPFEQFSRDVASVHASYNVHYLKAEYQFAVTSAQMAAKWADVERDGERYNLQYRTADDENVREAHRVLHNTTLPVIDPFWDKYYPPNGWGCRCNIVQVRKSKYETSDSEQAMADGFAATRQMSGGVDKGAIFRFNPGKSREVFPPKHPYCKMAPDDKTRVKAVVEKIVATQHMVDLTQIISGKAITESDFKNIMTVYAEKYNANYNGGLLDIVVKRNGSSFMSNGRYIHKPGNILTLHNHNFTISKDVVFNPYRESKDAFNSILKGKPLTFTQEYAMESIWHETLYAKAVGWKDRTLRNDLAVMQMETINQFIARNTYPQFIESFGGKATNQQQVVEQGYGYGRYVKNFRELLKHHEIDDSEVVSAMSDKLLNEPYENVGASTIRFLESKGVKNADECMNSLDTAEKSFLNLLNPNL